MKVNRIVLGLIFVTGVGLLFFAYSFINLILFIILIVSLLFSVLWLLDDPKPTWSEVLEFILRALLTGALVIVVLLCTFSGLFSTGLRDLFPQSQLSSPTPTPVPSPTPFHGVSLIEENLEVDDQTAIITSTLVITNPEMEMGNFVFVAPISMDLNESALVRLSLVPSASGEISDASVTIITPSITNSQPISNTSVYTGSVRLHSRMSAELTGINFDIVSSNPKEQSIFAGQETLWTWTISSKKEGSQVINVAIIVPLEFRSGTAILSRAIRTEAYTIMVNKPWWMVLQETVALQEFWIGTIVLGFLGVVAKWWMGRNATPTKPEKIEGNGNIQPPLDTKLGKSEERPPLPPNTTSEKSEKNLSLPSDPVPEKFKGSLPSLSDATLGKLEKKPSSPLDAALEKIEKEIRSYEDAEWALLEDEEWSRLSLKSNRTEMEDADLEARKAQLRDLKNKIQSARHQKVLLISKMKGN